MRLLFPFLTRTHKRMHACTHTRTQTGVIVDISCCNPFSIFSSSFSMPPAACEYEKYFDFEYEEEQYSTCEDEGSFCTAPTSPSLCLPPPLEHELVNSDKLDHCASRDSGVGSLRSDRTSTKGSSTGGSSRDSGEGLCPIP